MSQFQQPSYLANASPELQALYGNLFGSGGIPGQNTQQGQQQQQQGPFSPTPVGYQFNQNQQMGPFGPGSVPTPGFGTTPTSLYGEEPANTLLGQQIPSFFMSDQLAGAALGDYQNLIDAEQFNRERAQGQIDQFGNLLQQVPGVIQGTAAQQAQGLRDQASGFAESLEEEARSARDAYRETLTAREAEIDESIERLRDEQSNQASSMALGVDRSTQSMMNQINSGINPDGTMMTPAQKQAATAQATFQNKQMRQSALEGVLGQMATEMFGAEIQGTQMKMGLDQAGFGADQSVAQAMEIGQQYMASAYQNAAAMESAAATQATQFLLTGQQNMYEMYKTNPYAPVALFDTLAAIYSIKMNEPLSDFAKVGPMTGDFFTQGLSGQLPTL
tara:strand:- start:5849 stop:7015 length:1167 start_codon:yes stop_codon:yes gene_type:complete